MIKICSKNNLYLVLIFISTCFAGNIFAQQSKWVGYYDFYTEASKQSGEKISLEWTLQIKQVKNKLIAIYSKKENDKTVYHWKLHIKTTPTKASFYFNKLLGNKSNKFLAAKPLKHSLIFELVTTEGNGDPLLYTIWQTPALIVATGVAGPSTVGIFFIKRLYNLK